MTTMLDITPGPHLEGATIRLPGRAAEASRGTVTLRAPDDFPESQGNCQVEAEGNDLLIRIPREFATLFESHTSYRLELPELHSSGDVLDWPALPTSTAAFEEERRRKAAQIERERREAEEKRQREDAERQRREAEEQARTPEPPPIQTLAPKQPVRKKTVLLPILLGGLISLLLLATAGFFTVRYFLHHASSPLATLAPSRNTSPEPAGDSLASLSVPDVIKQAGTANRIGHEGQNRLTQGKPDDGVLLLEEAARRGDSPSMARLAHLYDPTTFDPKGPIPSADAREAAQYYQSAAKAGDTTVTADRAKLHDTLQKQAASGDEVTAQTAQSALKDFWP